MCVCVCVCVCVCMWLDSDNLVLGDLDWRGRARGEERHVLVSSRGSTCMNPNKCTTPCVSWWSGGGKEAVGRKPCSSHNGKSLLLIAALRPPPCILYRFSKHPCNPPPFSTCPPPSSHPPLRHTTTSLCVQARQSPRLAAVGDKPVHASRVRRLRQQRVRVHTGRSGGVRGVVGAGGGQDGMWIVHERLRERAGVARVAVGKGWGEWEWQE